MTETDRIIDRMMEMTKTTNYRELGEVVGGNVYQAVKLERIPDRWFEHLKDKYGADKQYLKTGVRSAAPEATAEVEIEVEKAEVPVQVEHSESTSANDPDLSLAADISQIERKAGSAQAMDLPAEHATISPREQVSMLSSVNLEDVPLEVLIDELMDRLPRATITIRRTRAW